MSIMKYLDRVMENLQDLKWHDIEEIKQMNVPVNKLTEVLHFLEEQGLIIREDEKLMITPKGLKFLDLPR